MPIEAFNFVFCILLFNFHWSKDIDFQNMVLLKISIRLFNPISCVEPSILKGFLKQITKYETERVNTGLIYEFYSVFTVQCTQLYI